MVKKIIAFIIVVLALAAAFFASYTLSLKYWDKIAPFLHTDDTATPADAAPVTTTEAPVATPTEAAATLPATTVPETTTAALLIPELAVENIVEMPVDETWKLVLLNRHNRIIDTYEPVLAPIMEGSTVQVDRRMTEAFQKMYNAALADGVTLTPVAGYISKELQSSLYEKKVEELAAQGMTAEAAASLAAESILPAGCSEDNIGISVCIGMQLDSFAQTDAYKWLQENAWKYGFIERYTAEKKAVTEVNARPWYWRYIGTDTFLAEQVHETGQCLEELLQQ